MEPVSQEASGYTPALFYPGFMPYMLEGLGQGLIACDRNGRLICVNRIAREIFGADLFATAVLSPGLARLVDSPSGVFPLHRALAGESFAELEFLYRRTGILLKFTGGPVRNSKGENFGAVVTFRDVSDRTGQQEEPQPFALLACHDLRAPFASIAVLAEAARHESDIELQKDYLFEAGRIAEQALDLVDDIFGIAILKNDPAPGDATFLTTRLVESVERVVRPIADHKGVELELMATPARVRGMVGRMAQVLQNLITNAIKFTEPGGRVGLQISRHGKKGRVRFAVTDEGLGMDREHVRLALAGSVKSRRDGTDGEISRGYGLLLVREILEAHGSRLYVRSQQGAGSVFVFRLPLV